MYDALLQKMRAAAGDRVWGIAVQHARGENVRDLSADGEETVLLVRAPGKPHWHTVHLWPAELDWGCDCDLPGACCLHACAAAIVVSERERRRAVPAPPIASSPPAVAYEFVSRGDTLTLRRRARSAAVEGSAAEDVPAERVRQTLADIEADATVRLDGRTVRTSDDPVPLRVAVRDRGEGFVVALVAPPGVDRLFHGAALVGDVLRPTSTGDLSAEQRATLTVGRTFTAAEARALVGEVLPPLAARIPVDLETTRLPRFEAGAPSEPKSRPRALAPAKGSPPGRAVPPAAASPAPPERSPSRPDRPGGVYEALLQKMRATAGDRVWGSAVQHARDGNVRGLTADDEEIHLQVRAPGKQKWHDVHLWPAELDWGCDCDLPGDCCVHACAAAISLAESGRKSAGLPAPKVEHRVRVRYELTAQGDALHVRRVASFADGSEEVLKRSLAQLDLVAQRVDVQAEALLAHHPGGELTAEVARQLLTTLEAGVDLRLDGKPVRLSQTPVLFRLKVTDDGEGFKIAMVRPTGIDRLFRGAALVGEVLHPTSHGDLTPDQRKMLVKGVTYTKDEVGTLVGEVLPKLSERIPVDVASTRLPKSDALVPRVLVELKERPGGLEVLANVVYGDPPVAKVSNAGVLVALTDAVVPARDMGAERIVARVFLERTGVHPGLPKLLPPAEAAAFLQSRLPKHDGLVKGTVDPRRFEIKDVDLAPRIDLRDVLGGGGDHAWALDVTFGEGRGGKADTATVLEAWRSGKSLVPLLDGGYAPLPATWLADHGAMLQEILEARDGKGRVQRNATAALIELLEGTDSLVPPDLQRLRTFLEGGEGLPEVRDPVGLTAELRPYQRAGLQWMRFLRDMDLHGVLADDMGLGKTLQALCAMADAGGRHLVIAPTSVLTNWAREAARFFPHFRVCVYHGPDRELDPTATITLTSYALLRMDLEKLRAVEWDYAVLDEAQAIKNPGSLTARSAFAVRAKYRLCLTGTPVENRLEELWSLFRYLMPGLLGSEAAFKDRFVRPVEAGDPKARDALRGRVRPYVLRRLKSQVETELPALTEIVERIPLEGKQRDLYDVVRVAARSDVQAALAQGGAATMQVLEALLRMRQACCDPALLPGDVGEGAPAAKLDRLEEILVEVVSENHKVLVFSQWTGLLDRVELRLRSLNVEWARLDGATRDRQAVVDRFQSDDGPPVFLLSLKAGGFGLNLTAADYVVHLDPWWNPAVERQATDRAHRIGQDKPVVSYKLVAEGTVEERILELQSAKRELADAALGTEGGFLRALSASELRSLFDAA